VFSVSESLLELSELLELLFELDSLSKVVDFAFGIKMGEVAIADVAIIGVDNTKSSLSPIIGKLAKVDCPPNGC